MQDYMTMGNELKLIFTSFIILLIGIIFLGVIADTTDEITTTRSVANENITVTSAQINIAFINATYDDWVSVVNVSNASNQLMTVTTDYTVNLAYGGINISTAGNNTDSREYYYVSYQFYPDNYVKSAPTRAFIPLIIIFFAIFLIGAAMMAVDWGWIKSLSGGGKGRI